MPACVSPPFAGLFFQWDRVKIFGFAFTKGLEPKIVLQLLSQDLAQKAYLCVGATWQWLGGLRYYVALVVFTDHCPH
jgi:hypothetical protein